jgi:hypothetical protein
MAAIAMVFVAGMMRHTLASSGINTVMEGVVSGLGIDCALAVLGS